MQRFGVCFVCDNYTYTALQSVRGIILTENVVMFQCFVLFLVALFFWKVYNSFLVVWQNRHRETGTPSENYDEETWFGIQINEERQLLPKGNLALLPKSKLSRVTVIYHGAIKRTLSHLESGINLSTLKFYLNMFQLKQIISTLSFFSNR